MIISLLCPARVRRGIVDALPFGTDAIPDYAPEWHPEDDQEPTTSVRKVEAFPDW